MSETCPAALNIRGEHFPCQIEAITHPGLAHSNADAEAIWTDDGAALTAAWASAEAAGR